MISLNLNPLKQVDMAKTCYRDCWWLIQAVAGEFGTGSFRNGTGYTMRELNNLRPMADRLTWKPVTEVDKEVDEEYLRDKEKFRKDVNNWKAIIYNEFGLVIMMESTSGPDHHGNGGYYYYLANPDLLDKGGKSLRDHIKFLAESETKRDEWVSVQEMTELYKSGSLTMGFISAGGSISHGYLSNSNTAYRTILGEENLPLVQFAMVVGEVLTIRYGKVRAGIDINAPYSFEPYQVKEIEGRWYAIGNLYPMGHKESAELAVYDLGRIEFAYDEENPDVRYEPIEGFEVNEYIRSKAVSLTTSDRIRIAGDLRIIDIKTHSEDFAGYITKNPLCLAQEKLGDGKFRIYARLTNNLIVQMGAYGEEITLGLPKKEGEEKMDRYKIRQGLNLFRNGSTFNYDFE